MALSEVNHVSLSSFTEDDCPGRCKTHRSIDVNGGSNEPRLSKSFTVSARKEYAYMLYKVIFGAGSCCSQCDVTVYFVWK